MDEDGRMIVGEIRNTKVVDVGFEVGRCELGRTERAGW